MRGKVVVITGASAGIGAALAELVSGRGADAVLVARREARLREVAGRCGPGALAVVADVTCREDVVRARDEALERFGRIDAWVNNAGRGITCPVSMLSDEDFDEMMLVNVKSALYGMQAVLPHFKQRGAGHIVNVSSMLSRVPFAPQRSAYSAAKHALNALTANLRMELAADFPGIVVSSVHPGVVATEFGANARHGGVDSRQVPGAQSAGDVARVIADLLESPRADVYTRPGAQDLVVRYYAAEDMGLAERQPPFVPGPMPPRT